MLVGLLCEGEGTVPLTSPEVMGGATVTAQADISAYLGYREYHSRCGLSCATQAYPRGKFGPEKHTCPARQASIYQATATEWSALAIPPGE